MKKINFLFAITLMVANILFFSCQKDDPFVNTPPSIEDQQFSVNENSPNGTLVDTVKATDSDKKQLLIFSIVSGNTNNAFSIDSINGIIRINNSNVLDYELYNTFELAVRVKDNYENSLSSTAKITIKVININEPEIITDQFFTIDENKPNETLVGTIKAFKPANYSILKYYINSGNLENAFKLDSLNGNLYVNNYTAIDYEHNQKFELTIKVKYDFINKKSAYAKITINLNDIYENKKPHICDQDFVLDENKPNNTYVGTIQATDKDLGQTLSFSIIAGNTDAAFRIESNTGKLFVNNISALNYEVNQSFALQVKVSDNYTSSLSDTAIVTVKIQDIEEISMPLNGLVAYYPFNGNAKDESGNSHNGTVYGATLTTDRHHKANSAYEFNGINNYINTFSTFNYEYRTVSFWVNPYDIHKTGLERNIALIQDSYENSYGSIIVFFGDNNLSMNAGGTLPANQYYTSNVSENRWYHIVLVRNGAQTLYYINGDLVSTGVSGTVGSTSNPNPFLIFGSGRTTTVNFFSGKIDEIAIYNRALSASEINTIYGVK